MKKIIFALLLLSITCRLSSMLWLIILNLLILFNVLAGVFARTCVNGRVWDMSDKQCKVPTSPENPPETVKETPPTIKGPCVQNKFCMEGKIWDSHVCRCVRRSFGEI